MTRRVVWHNRSLLSRRVLTIVLRPLTSRVPLVRAPTMGRARSP